MTSSYDLLVDWSNSGGANATVRVTCGGKEIPCTMKRIKRGLHVCSFIPRQVGLHLIDVMIDEMLLPGTVSKMNQANTDDHIL